MYKTLTKKQQEIVDCNKPRIIVKACPGSGKTYSVTARLEQLLKKGKFRHQGIAVLSFTNNACNEIKEYLDKLCDIKNVGYPHFIGTLDSFINNYIFLPYGHLVMGCEKRPEIVGTEYNRWFEFDYSKTKHFKGKTTYRDPNYYFDKTTFNKAGNLIPNVPYSEFHFGKGNWDNPYVKDGKTIKKVIGDILYAKQIHFKEGKATQADANYLSYKLLEKFPVIAKNLAKRFPKIIVDEAQDTTELQMGILDILEANSVESMMLIGDPNQAIFEWNTADSSLFMDKYKSEDWFPINLDENRRSSQKICNLLNRFYGEEMKSVSDFKDIDINPKIVGHDNTEKTINQIRKRFLKYCKDEGIRKKDIAVVYRGSKFGEDFFNLPNTYKPLDHLPWENKYYYVRDLVYGKYLIENGSLKDGLKLLEKGFHKLKNPDLKFVSSKFIQKQIDNKNFRLYRKELFGFLDQLPTTEGKLLSEWIDETEEQLNQKLKIKRNKDNLICNLFIEKSNTSAFKYHLDSIHSVKGSTYDALLVFLKKASANSDYKTILKKSYRQYNADTIKRDEEEIRIVYVACSRPRKILWIAVHEGQHKTVWEDKLIN